MEANKIENNIYKNPYNNLSFWANEIINDNNLWEGYFNNKEITKDSKIIYTGILDLNKNILQCGWAVYPCAYSLLGFLQYVYLPTAFFIWFDHKSDLFYIPVSDFEDVVSNTLKYSNSNVNLNSVNSMKNNHDFLNSLWNSSPEILSSKLNTFSDTFNTTWDNDPNQKLFIKIFDSTCDTFKFIKESIAWNSKEFIEEDISMTFEALRFACENAIDEPLLNRRFIDILNTNAPILF